jgi:uncharacterized protein YdaU (DUF1376 family)
MARLPYMPLDVGALLSDTEDLSNEEFGAYLRILFATWRNNGKPYLDDDVRLARLARAGSNRWRTELKPRLMRFFDISDGYWHQKRLENVYESTLDLSEKQRVKGVISGEVRRAKKSAKRLTDNDSARTVVRTEREPNSEQSKTKYIKSLKTLDGEGKKGASNGVAIATPHPTRTKRNSNAATLGPDEGKWRTRLRWWKDDPSSWEGNWGPPPDDPRSWFLIAPDVIPYAPLLAELGIR